MGRGEAGGGETGAVGDVGGTGVGGKDAGRSFLWGVLIRGFIVGFIHWDSPMMLDPLAVLLLWTVILLREPLLLRTDYL